MRTFAKSQIRYSKSQRMGIFALIGLIVAIEITSFFLHQSQEIDYLTEIPPEVLALQSEVDQNLTQKSQPKNLQNFNPNALSAEEWQSLGFSEKQVNTILKYKYSLGGNFTSNQQIKDCFVISESKFSELEPYIQLSKVNSQTNSQSRSTFSNSYSSSNSENYPKKEKIKIQYSKFNPNEYSVEDWQRIGFSEKQANSILKYKKSLGGKFSNLEQIQASYVISEEKFKEMKPYLVLPSETQEVKNSPATEKPEPKVEKMREKFNPNDLTKEEWMDLGFSEKQVTTILNYKKSLGGKFKNAEVLKKCYSISEEKFQEIEAFLVFE
jgi:DNA uptake protein ComE-like DNA-binding protein